MHHKDEINFLSIGIFKFENLENTLIKIQMI